MSELNLLRYYVRLQPMGVGIAAKTTLQEVADLLFTTPRHTRSLLTQMQQAGWLQWQPKSGRNQRSQLMLNIELASLKEQLATTRIRAGKYEKALAILDQDQNAFGRLLKNTSGASLRAGRLHIQLTYKRPFEQILPHHLQRSSERFLIRQLYCCLLSCDKDGQLHPELAHHWRSEDDDRKWTFYLRPGLTFHNGAAIDASTIVSLFAKLSSLDLYRKELAHLDNIVDESPLKVVFTLKQSDRGFAGLIAGVRYAIQPVSQVNATLSPLVIGSGPFEMEEHSDAQFKLRAFENYFACRAITDQVTIWLIDEQTSARKQIETNQPEASHEPCDHYVNSRKSAQESHPQQQSRVEDGCLLLMYNQTGRNAFSPAQRRYLSGLLTPQRVQSEIAKMNGSFGSVTAHNLLPQWQAVVRPKAEKVKLPKYIDLAIYNYKVLSHCARAIQSLLAEQGCRVTIQTYSYRGLDQKAREGELSEALILTNISLDDNRHASAFCNLFSNPILHACIGETASEWLDQQLIALRAEVPLVDYLDKLEPIASALINEYWISPLFHHLQTLRFHGVLQDVALTNWGWPDIRNVWAAE
ncbi:transporter [Vibrio cidicii]|uniref:Transporter n=1 Tax=Vibrio cidicii TaxID=1763883 RepID=A0A151JDW6_9VIBR|nr:transporter [Vibrio cidicii]